MQEFDKWVVNFMGPINPPSRSIGAQYIITVTDSLIRLVEATPVRYCTTTTATRFLLDDVLTRFGCPKILVSDQGMHFVN